MPRRGRAGRTRARRTRARTHFTSHAARQARQRRTNRRRHHRRNITRSRGTTRAVTGSHGAAGVSLQPKRASCMAMSLFTGVVLVIIGLTVTFQVSVYAGIAPIALGTLSVAAGFILCIANFNKPTTRTVEITPTPAPQIIATAPGFEVPSANIYSDQAPSYAATIGLSGNAGMQYGAFESPTTMNQELPPPSYAEATMKTS